VKQEAVVRQPTKEKQMSIYHADKEFFDPAAHPFFAGEGRIEEGLLLSLGWGEPHAEGLPWTTVRSAARCAEQTLPDTEPVTIESSQPWLGYW
jgi:hypothetical protein